MNAETDESPLHLPGASNVLLEPGWNPTPEAVAPYLNAMILSASGWRSIFAADGEEESPTPNVRRELLLLVGLAARVYAEQITSGGLNARVAVGADTRPTGPILAQAAIRCLIGEQVDPEYLFVVASPEIMAYTGATETINGFFYISASHNPIGHNGLKMGLGDGSVAGGEVTTALADKFRTYAADPGQLATTAEMLRIAGTQTESLVYRKVSERKKAAATVYRELSERVIRGPGPDGERAFAELTARLQTIRPGIVADMNGCARSVSIDQSILTDAGCRLQSINDTPGVIRHQIVPEGAGLDECVSTLAATTLTDPGFILGYVPDNDGDRGNLVISDRPGSARPLEAQEVFALSAVSELSWLFYTGAAKRDASPDAQKLAVVVNGPTSMRIERIAEVLGAEVHRAEVGEANVVGRARELRDAGYTVRFLGEGSNGGNITHPSAVRDPIQTVFAVLKLLFAPDLNETPGPSRFWLHAVGRQAPAAVTIQMIIDSLPRFTTTSAYDPLAIMHVASGDHGKLKTQVERLWEERWPQLEDIRENLSVSGYRYENYEGTVCRSGKGNRTGHARGGLKILLTDDAGRARAFLWMRGSGTEPVFRVMVDVEGDQPDSERYLLNLLREMVTQADTIVAGDPESINP
jgi:phosphoglucomutase